MPSNTVFEVPSTDLAHVTGGASSTAQQAQLRSLAKRWCPTTSAKYAAAPALTRRMGERCLDEAGLGAFKSRLDAYFPGS